MDYAPFLRQLRFEPSWLWTCEAVLLQANRDRQLKRARMRTATMDQSESKTNETAAPHQSRADDSVAESQPQTPSTVDGDADADADHKVSVDVVVDPIKPAMEDRNAQSLPYKTAGRPPAGRWSARTATATAGLSAPEPDDHYGPNDMVRSALSYSMPTPAAVAQTPRSRPAVDVLATYMCDSRPAKTDLLRRYASPSGNSQARIRAMSKEASAEWGYFVDIDSSGESWAGADGSLSHLRRKMSADLGLGVDANAAATAAVHVLGDEQANTRITAAHKAFDVVTDGMSRVVSGTIQIPKFRIVQSRSGTDRHAQYLITFRLGKEMYADWRRYSEFAGLAKKLPPEAFQRTQLAWRSIDTRWFNRLEPSYLHKKCITLENFMRELMYESTDPSLLIEFLGGFLAKVNALPVDPEASRPAAQLPKELRPPQPKHERELFEKVWAENFKRSCVDYTGAQA